MLLTMIKGAHAPAVLGGLAIVCLTVLLALHDVTSDVAIPLLTALAGGGLGHVNGYRQAVTEGNGGANGTQTPGTGS